MNKYYLDEHAFTVEDFGSALFVDGIVCPRTYCSYSVFTGSRCWGHTVTVPGSSYVRTGPSFEFRFCPDPTEFIIDDVGDMVEVIQILQTDPLRIKCFRYVGTDSAEDTPPTSTPLWDDFCWHRDSNGVVIDGYTGDPTAILIPPSIMDLPVLRVDFDDSFLPHDCEIFIVSKGVGQLDVRFDDVMGLVRVEIPDSVELLAPPDHIPNTFWFLNKPEGEPVYLCGYYCGTPCPGLGADSSLILREGTIGIAGCADLRNYWHHIYIPDSVTYIGRNAFMLSPCLESVRLSACLTELGDSAFFQCGRLTELYLPDSLLSPGQAFRGRPSLPTTGSTAAYPNNGSFVAAGRLYPSCSSLAVRKIRYNEAYLDCYGKRVLHLRHIDTQLLTNNGGYYCDEHWYLTGPSGVTQIEMLPHDRVLVVRDGISLDEVPDYFRPKVEQEFFHS